MLSSPLIVTPLWSSICKPMNSLEVSRIAGFYTQSDISKKIFWGSSFNTTPPVKVYLHNASHYTTVITPKMSDTLTFLYILPCTCILRFRDIFSFFFLLIFFFWEKNCAPHFLSLSYTIMVVQI